MSEQQKLQTVERAFTFMEYVAGADAPPTVQQISAALKLNITTCYHVMRTLLALGYLDRKPDATLVLGAKIGSLYRAYHQAFDLDQSLGILVNRLVEQTAEFSFVSVLQGDRVVLKILAEATKRLRVGGLYVGHSGNEHRRASGKAVLAHCSSDFRTAILGRALADMPVRARKQMIVALDEDLALIRERGWSLDAQTEVGVTGLAAPIFDGNGTIFGAIGVVAPNFDLDRSQDEYVRLVVSAASQATALLRDGSS